MKILHLETGRHFYGGARQVAWLIRGLAAGSVDNVLVCTPGHRLAREVTDAEVVELPMAGDLDFSLYRKLRRLIREHRPEVVHIHSRRGADIFGGRAAKAEGVPALLTRRVQSDEPGFWLRWKCRPYTAVAAISPAVLRELSLKRVDRCHTTMISSAVDAELFSPDATARERVIARYGLPVNARIAGMAAQFIARKGHELLLPIVSRVCAQVPEFRLLLFGQGPQREHFEREVRAAGLEQSILFCGFERDWPKLLPGLELLLHPARREGLGVVVLEAMAAGVPVVAADVGGIPDVIDRSIDGLLLPPEDAEGWSRAVVHLLSHRHECERLAQKARRKVEQQFTIRHMAKSYISLYDDLRNHRV